MSHLAWWVASDADQNPTFGSLEVRLTWDELCGQFRPAGGDFTDELTIAAE